MDKLEYIIEDNMHLLFKQSKKQIINYIKMGKMKVVKVPNPTIDPSSVIDYLPKLSIEKGANAFVVSDFNPDAQAIIDNKTYSFYALQFYYIW